MSVHQPEIEIVESASESVRYLEHGWPTDLCRWHAHAEYELHYLLRTTGSSFVGDYIGNFGPKSLFLTGPYLPHNWVTDTAAHHNVPLRDKLVQFSQKSITAVTEGFPEFRGMQALLNQASRGIEFTGFDAAYVEGCLDFCRDNPGVLRVTKLLELLVHLSLNSEARSLSVVEFTDRPLSRNEAQIGEAVDYVVKNFAEDLSVTAISQQIGLSENNFSRRFRKITGNRFKEFVNRVRVGEACARLQQTPDPVSTICYDVGFQNLANFNRHFQRMKGLTPTEYRNQMRLANSGGAPETAGQRAQ